VSFAVGPYDPTRPLVIDPVVLGYSTYLGGGSADYALGGMVVDSAGYAYVGGATKSTNFPSTPGAFDTDYNGGTWDAFVTKLNAAGSALVYSTYLGGSAYDIGHGIAVDSAAART
jgi:beta-propeller repeat-containing protein